MAITLKYKKLNDRAKEPFRATAGAAAYDLCAANEQPIIIPAGGIAPVPTGIAIELPSPDYVALLFSRSGHGAKFGVTLANSVGVIDSDYRGELIVSLINAGAEPFTVNPGDRTAQLMIVPVAQTVLQQADELGETDRGAGGFGSTGRR